MPRAARCRNAFWMGDLNYRINLDMAGTIKLVQENNLAELQTYDQVRACTCGAELDPRHAGLAPRS
jgi:hypothetical protein